MTSEHETTNFLQKMKSAHLIVGAVFLVAGAAYWGMSLYTKNVIQGSWVCRAADGRLAGMYEFSDHDSYLETHSRYEQYYGDYDVEWKTIKTSIVGAAFGTINADEKHPIRGEIDFLEKSNGALLLRIWPGSHPMGIVVNCEKDR